MNTYKLNIKNTQAKYKVVENNITQQCSYNLPKALFEYLLGNDILVHYQNDNDNINYHYKLNDDYQLILGNNIKLLLNIENDTYHNFICANVVSNGKPQLKRTDYNQLAKTHQEYQWFVNLYDKALVGSDLTFTINDENQELILDIIFEKIYLKQT